MKHQLLLPAGRVVRHPGASGRRGSGSAALDADNTAATRGC